MSSVPPVPPQQPMTDAYGRPYGYGQPYGYPAPAPTNALAIVALVLALMGISIGGVVAGHLSLSQIKRTSEQGRGMALAGLIVGSGRSGSLGSFGSVIATNLLSVLECCVRRHSGSAPRRVSMEPAAE